MMISSSANARQIKFIDCEYNNPIEDLFIFSADGKHLGITDKNGICQISESFSKIKVIGLIIKDTLISLDDVETICLKLFHNNLQEVIIEENHIELKDLYVKMLEGTWNIMQKKDTTFYYNFKYIITVPDSNWQEIITGVIKIHAYPYKKEKIFPRVDYCMINYDVDKDFIKSPVYQYSTTNLFAFINIPLDLMYSKKKSIEKDVKNKIKNIELKTRGDSMIFTMNKSNSKIKTKQKSYFENDLLVKNEVYSNEENAGNGLNSFYRTSEYTITSKGKILRKHYYKKIVQKQRTFFLTEFELSLFEGISEKCLEYPVNLQLNYQNWLKIIKKKQN